MFLTLFTIPDHGRLYDRDVLEDVDPQEPYRVLFEPSNSVRDVKRLTCCTLLFRHRL